jgi:putative FmdB family regulatory protein
MPFYEYECASCKFYTEVMQKITDAPLRKCPSCGKSTLKKLVSAPVFRLKGGGWYETDFKSDQETKRNLAEKAEAGESKPAESGAESKAAEGKADAKADAKSDAKPDAKPAETKPAASKSSQTKPAGRTSARKPVAAAARRAAPRKPAKPKPKSRSARKGRR